LMIMKKNKLLIVCRCIILLLLIAGVAWLPKSGPQTGALDDSKTVKGNENHPPAKKKIVFIAGPCSHGPGEHEHFAGCKLLAGELNKNLGNLAEAIVYQGWPKDTTTLNDASSIVMYMDGGIGHLALRHMQHMMELMNKGVGFTSLHYAVEVQPDNGGPEFTNWLGGYFEINWSVNPTWTADYKSLPKHPVTNGVKPFSLNDEWYYHMRFRENMNGVTPILTAVPPASTLDRGDGPHEGNEFVRKEMGKPQHMAWVTERQDGGRGFGFTGGHYHKNWGNQNVRKLVLNGIAWTARITVPKQGVPGSVISGTQLAANLDTKPCVR
ncbi:MAG TPA: ThuA domain-containing protein, partial [Chitinophagaceae bacterium]|nr:ThuA domain-containing protein [Chitinophagaceae bacterium]